MQRLAVHSLLLCCCVAPLVGRAGPTSDIEQLEKDFNAAYAANDMQKYFGYCTDDARVHTESFQESDVWFKTGTGWKIAHVHYSAASKPVKPKLVKHKHA